MSIYFLVHDGAFFHRQVKPALSASWQQRSFEPCRSLCASLVPAAQSFAERYHTGPEEPVLSRVGHGLPFDRDIWRYLVGEILLVAAQEIPEIQTAPDTLFRLLAPDRCGKGEIPRQQFAPIQQAHFGSRDLAFGGGYYRPDQAGWNDESDVARLAEYLQTVDPASWTATDLAGCPELGDDEERAEELEFVREWFPVLQSLYRQARGQNQVIVCETLQWVPVS